MHASSRETRNTTDRAAPRAVGAEVDLEVRFMLLHHATVGLNPVYHGPDHPTRRHRVQARNKAENVQTIYLGTLRRL